MSQVKLIVEQHNTLPGSGKVIDLNLSLDEGFNIVGVIRTDFDTDLNGETRSNDDLAPVIHYGSINHLVGKLLTMIDATVTDKEQRQAQKDLFKQIAWDWYQTYRDNLTYPWRIDKEATTPAQTATGLLDKQKATAPLNK